MSRIGKKPIPIPEKVSVQVQGLQVEVKGPAGTMTRTIPEGIVVQMEGKNLVISVAGTITPQKSALFGLTRTLIANMVHGVLTPWKRDLEIQGVGFRASKNGQVLNLALGYSHPIDFKMPAIVQFNVDAKQTFVSMSSPDKELLGDIAAKIRAMRPPEPYKGKGVRYAGEHILRKAGKAAGAVGGGKK